VSDRKAPRWPILLLILVAAGGVVMSAIYGPGAKKNGGLDPEPAAKQATPATNGAPAAATAQPATAAPNTPPAAPQPTAALGDLKARLPQGSAQMMQFPAIGSLDPSQQPYRVDFAKTAAGIERIVFSDFWMNARDREMAVMHRAAVARGDANPPALPPDAARYELRTLGTLQGYSVPLLAARAIEIDGQLVSLFGAVWAQSAPGTFNTEVVDAGDRVVATITRAFAFRGNGYDMQLSQRVQNTSDRALKIRWIQYGPGDLTMDASGMMDIRRFQFGYLYSPQRDPSRQSVIVHGAMFDRADVLKRVKASTPTLWPQDEQRQQGFELSWFGTTNRYFSLAVHARGAEPQAAADAKQGAPDKVLSSVQEVWALSDETSGPQPVAFTELRSAEASVASGQGASFDMGVFAGPLDPKLLEHVQPFESLRMDGLILYLIGGCCSFCTFAWLANLIVLLLTFLHDWVVFDWSLAIIVLVILVRTALHPVTRYSQIQMARVTKGMASIKPELEALQKRYAGDPKKMQSEQMRLYREKGINPVGCVGGMLPTFLQMPIWIALYAVLYFAFDLRQKPAFFGVFQQMGGWRFLGDLSSPDHFIEFANPIGIWKLSIAGINLIPLLMAFVFFLQQKYMAPPTTGNMTPEQEQQQKMMKWMTVILFPVMLYTAPSGLTLYIMTSTCIGIIEGKRIRGQIEKMDFTPRKREPGKQDRLGKLYEAAMKRAQEKRQQGKRFKDRG
jgi:YidC/Oxa1 family membrane protein insertase